MGLGVVGGAVLGELLWDGGGGVRWGLMGEFVVGWWGCEVAQFH